MTFMPITLIQKIMAYKPNDITVDACWSWIYNTACTKKPMFLSLEWETLEQNYL